jgi:CRP/FNR family transcriptional regulator, anaerobic regulatory protein
MAKHSRDARRLRAEDINPDSHLGALLALLGPERRSALAALGEVRTAAEGEVLLADGAEAAEVGYLLDGFVGMIKRLPDGRAHIIGLLAPTDIYGRIFDGPSHHAIEALTEVRICTFRRDAFEQLLRDDPEVERLFLLNLLDELDAAREWLLLMTGTRIVERVAAFLMILSRRITRDRGTDGPITIHVPLRRTALAHHLGTRPETLSRALHQLEADGVVQFLDPYRFKIPSLAKLTRALGEESVLNDIEHQTQSAPTRY